MRGGGGSSTAARALAYFVEDHGSRHFEPRFGRSLTVHPAANRDLVETLGR